MQNSTVYLTYPSNQTKRFSHSLGTMHLSSQMFYYSIVNSNPDVKDELLRKVEVEIKNILNDGESRRFLNRVLGKFVQILDNFNFTHIIKDPFYNSITPYTIQNDHVFSYLVLLQSIRCAALLHDVGHPPFSHITEYALQEVLKIVKALHPEELTARQKLFLNSLNFSGDEQLHERIGTTIAERLLDSVIPTQILTTQDEAFHLVFYWIISHFTMSILKEKSNLFTDIHRIISGAIDCDRLDYVTRDLLNSGISCGKIEYDRLIYSMKLIKSEDRFGFCISIRSLSTIDDFFRRRLQLYSYIIYHHRVIKTDYLLAQAIITLSLDYLTNPKPEENPANNVLPLDISGLWKAIRNVYSDINYFDALIQWDDTWLLTVLKQQFFETYIQKEDNIKYQLEEILSNRKNYVSIIKKTDDFLGFDNEFAKIFSTNLAGIIDIIDEPLKLNLNSLKQHINLSTGLYLNKVFRDIFEVLQEEKSFQQCIRDTIIKHSQSYGAADCIVVFKKLSTGLGVPPFLYKASELISLDNFSGLSQNLDLVCMAFPTFFIYIKENSPINRNKFLNELGKLIAEKIISLLNH